MKVWRTKSLASTGELTATVWIRDGDVLVHESSPIGCTTGKHEVPEYMKADEKFEQRMKGVRKGMSQEAFDARLKGLGSRISTAASLAFFRLKVGQVPMGMQLKAGWVPTKIICNLVNGGKHAGKQGFCEFMILPQGKTAQENVEIASKVFRMLGSVLKAKGQDVLVSGREGGYVVGKGFGLLQVLACIEHAINDAMLRGRCCIGIDVAANNLFDKKRKKYCIEGRWLSRAELVEFYCELAMEFDIRYFEDPFHEDDVLGWQRLRRRLKCGYIAADDLTVTDARRIRKYRDCFDVVVCKVNQVGTVTGLFAAVAAASESDCQVVMSQRSGETDSSVLIDLASVCGAEMVKAGAPARERIVKYNRLIEMEEMEVREWLK